MYITSVPFRISYAAASKAVMKILPALIPALLDGFLLNVLPAEGPKRALLLRAEGVNQVLASVPDVADEIHWHATLHKRCCRLSHSPSTSPFGSRGARG